MEENNQREYEEAELVDYVKVIKKRSRLVSEIFLATVVIAVIVSLILPKVYKIDAVIEIGVFNRTQAGDGLKFIEKPSDILNKIRSDAYGLKIRDNLKIPEKDYPKLRIEDPKDTDLIVISTTSARADQARNVLKSIGSQIVFEHQRIVENKTILINENMKRIEEKIKNAEEEGKNLEAKVDSLQKTLVYQQDPGTQYALFDAKEKLAAKKNETENLYMEVNLLKISLDDIVPTKMLKEPTVSEKLVSLSMELNVGIAALLGLFIGIFVAFGKEWWDKNGERMVNSKS